MTVFDIEGNFLSELVDYENETMTRELTLTVPERNSSAAWPGLLGDSSYRFRLISTCPAPLDSDDLDAPDVVRPNVTSYADLVIRTNAPPVGFALEIVPDRGGVAMKTLYKFSTGGASDRPADYPLHYSFQIFVRMAGETDGDGLAPLQTIAIVVGEFYENTVTNSWLPYSAEPIRTAYDVCDSRGACATIDGPDVGVQAPTASVVGDQLQLLTEQFGAAMGRLEFDGAFRLVSIAAVTLRNLRDQVDQKTRDGFRATVRTSIGEQTQRLKRLLVGDGTKPDDVYVSAASVVEFVDLARQSLAVTKGAGDDAAILNDLLALFELVGNMDADGGRRKRRKRSVDDARSKRAAQIDVIHAALNLTGDLLASGGANVQQIKLNLTQQVHKFMLSLCKKESFAPKSYGK